MDRLGNCTLAMAKQRDNMVARFHDLLDVPYFGLRVAMSIVGKVSVSLLVNMFLVFYVSINIIFRYIYIFRERDL